MDAGKMEALEGLVIDVDGQGGPTPEQKREAEAAQALDAGAREWGMIAYVVGNGLSMIAPQLKAVYTEDACFAWGRAMVPVAQKYKWDSPSDIPELGLVIATLSLGVPSVLAIRERVREMREAPAGAPSPAAPAAPDGV